jgi:hypothetical protein
MTESIDPEPYERAMWEQVASLEGKVAEIAALQEELADSRAALSVSMQRYGTVLALEGLTVPTTVVRKLYWEHRDIHASAIAESFGLRGGGSQVHSHAGEGYFDFPCPGGCGATVRLTARTSKERRCGACESRWQRSMEERHAARAADYARQNAEQEAYIRAELSKGRTAGDLYAELVGQYETNGPLPRLEALEREVRGAAGR